MPWCTAWYALVYPSVRRYRTVSSQPRNTGMIPWSVPYCVVKCPMFGCEMLININPSSVTYMPLTSRSDKKGEY